MMIMQTTQYGIIWSQNVHFVTTVPLTRTGVLYPRMQDFYSKKTKYHILMKAEDCMPANQFDNDIDTLRSNLILIV